MSNSDIRTIARQIFELDEQAEDIKLSRKALLEAAKEAGINPKALAAAIKVHRMDSAKRAAHDQTQSDLIDYLNQIERQAAE